ncbi:hypothetical protein [Dyella silvatica]|uniref:hypothetical protein n=1 Tax=Dyella silvatica TaxID=2992128 RepID=UPI0022529951|nr:hypothetical protein [Dyella silvatica]
MLCTFARAISFLLGALLFVMGVGTIGILTRAVISPDSGRLTSYFFSACCVLIGAPLIAVAFSTRVAKWLALFAGSLFGLMMLGMAFWPLTGVHPSIVFQVLAIAFATLLCVRVGSAIRHRRRAQSA